jgi:hypothetical protein
VRRLLLFVFAAASPLFASEIPVAPPALTQASYFNALAVASDGVDAVVAWVAVGTVRCAVVRAGGAGGDIVPRLLSNSANIPLYLGAAFAGGRYLIVWQGSRGIEGAILDRDGNILRTMLLANGEDIPILAAGGDRFLLAWGNHAAIVSPDGDVLGNLTLPSPVTAACASAGGFAALLTAGASRLPVVRISTDGRVTAQTDLQIDPNITVTSVSIASGGDGGLLIVWDAKWEGTFGFLTDFSFRRVSARFDFGPWGVYGPSAAVWDGSLYLVVVTGYRELGVMRLGIDAQPRANGWPREGTVVRVAGGYLVVAGEFLQPLTASLHPDLFALPVAAWHFTVVENQMDPAIATDGRSILAGWSVTNDRKHALLSNGSRRPLPDLTAYQLTFDGREFVGLYSPCIPTGCGTGERSAQFVSTDGEVAPAVKLEDGGALLWTGSLFFAFGGIDQPGLSVRRVRRSGDIIDAAPIIIQSSGFRVAGSTATNGRDAYIAIGGRDPGALLARVTAEGSVTLGDALTWAWPRIAAADDVIFVTGSLYGKIILVMSYTADLRPRWPKPIEIAPGWEAEIAADGRDAVVVWTDPGRGVFGARVTPEGVVQPFDVIVTAGLIRDLQIATGGGATAVAYSRVAPEEPYFGASRVFLHFFPPPPPRRRGAEH